MLVTFHAHGETGRYHSYRRGSNNLDQSISDRSLKWTEDKLVLVKIERQIMSSAWSKQHRKYREERINRTDLP